MATTTPNYGWTVPTSTDLVKDGATAIETLGDAIDASMNTALGTKKAGMVLLNTTSFSGVASQSFSSVFDTTLYDHWRVKLFVYASAGSTNLRIRGRANTTDVSANVYGSSFYSDYLGGTGVFSASNNAAQSTPCSLGATASNPTVLSFDVYLGDRTKLTINGQAYAEVDGKSFSFGYNHTGTSLNGFSLIPSANNITGTCSIYAYNK
jgi:hypothetical protein